MEKLKITCKRAQMFLFLSRVVMHFSVLWLKWNADGVNSMSRAVAWNRGHTQESKTFMFKSSEQSRQQLTGDSWGHMLQSPFPVSAKRPCLIWDDTPLSKFFVYSICEIHALCRWRFLRYCLHSALHVGELTKFPVWDSPLDLVWSDISLKN